MENFKVKIKQSEIESVGKHSNQGWGTEMLLHLTILVLSAIYATYVCGSSRPKTSF